MTTFLFNETIFGPIHSRRLGASLGINLLPNDFKYCTFDCIYCECGWTDLKKAKKINFLSNIEIATQLENKLKDFSAKKAEINNITFAGNGEPTVHPHFSEIINDTVRLRDKYYPNTEIAVLSNASMLHKPSIIEALNKIDSNIQKLDCGSEDMFQRINKPIKKILLSDIVKRLQSFTSNLTIQTLFLKGEYNGQIIDNTSDTEIELWLEHIKTIKPKMVMIYSIARSTPANNLKKIEIDQLTKIASKVENLGIKTQVY